MTHADALRIVITFAQVRADQWRAVANSENPADLIDELYECAAQPGLKDAREMADMIEEAIALIAPLEVKTAKLSWLSVEGLG